MRNLELKTDYLNARTFGAIRGYINSKEFQNDFPHGYWEEGDKASGKILEIKGDALSKGYRNVIIRLRDDEDLNYTEVKKNINKLIAHYQNIIKIIFSSKTA